MVIDRRVEGDIIGAVDISRLSDKVTSDHENIPYYITAALIPEYFNYKIPFRWKLLEIKKLSSCKI